MSRPSVGAKTLRRVARSKAEAHPETLAVPLSTVAATSPGIDAGPAETTGQPVTAQPLAGLPPPVAMLMAACALQKKLAASVQVR
ncbi:MAG: hypothetical protein IPG66_02860 [Hydrogenophilales bacterium]|nr:hypothetical protein [Hydrogenophilales bacterium]